MDKHRSRAGLIYICLLCVFSLYACRKSALPDGTENLRTVLVYMGGDNSLSDETDEKIESLRKASVESGRLLVFQDALGSSPRLIEIKSGNIILLKTYESENSASPAVFKNVLNDVEKSAPAASYGLILFSHASGWLPQRTIIKPSAVVQDGKEDLELIDFAAAIPDKFFDFIVFEACFMTGIEVMYELQNKTEFIVGSSAEILSPGFTPIYPQLIPLLFSKEPDLKGFAQIFFNYYNSLKGDYQSATIAVIRTSGLQPLAFWLKSNVDRTLPSSDLKNVQKFDRYADYTLFFDFEDHLQRVSPAGSHARLRELLNETVTYKAATNSFMKGSSGFDIKHFCGLTTYIPQSGFPHLNEEYKKLRWVKEAL